VPNAQSAVSSYLVLHANAESAARNEALGMAREPGDGKVATRSKPVRQGRSAQSLLA
jgi:hypothetical protein